MSNLWHKYLFIFFILLFLLVFFQSSLQAQIYPTQVKLIIRSQGELIGQDEFFEILEMDDYILIPLVSLSRWLDIDLNYDRENQLLTVYYEENDINIQVDFKLDLYYDFPEWSTDPPVVVEKESEEEVLISENLIHLYGRAGNWGLSAGQLIEYNFDTEEYNFESELSKKEDYAYIKLNVSSSLTDNLVLSSNLKSDFTWLEGIRDESDTDIDLRARLKTGKYTSITAGISSEVEFEKDKDGNDSTEEVEVFIRH